MSEPGKDPTNGVRAAPLASESPDRSSETESGVGLEGSLPHELTAFHEVGLAGDSDAEAASAVPGETETAPNDDDDDSLERIKKYDPALYRHRIRTCVPCIALVVGQECRTSACPYCHLSHEDNMDRGQRPARAMRHKCKGQILSCIKEHWPNQSEVLKELQKLVQCQSSFSRNYTVSLLRDNQFLETGDTSAFKPAATSSSRAERSELQPPSFAVGNVAALAKTRPESSMMRRAGEQRRAPDTGSPTGNLTDLRPAHSSATASSSSTLAASRSRAGQAQWAASSPPVPAPAAAGLLASKGGKRDWQGYDPQGKGKRPKGMKPGGKNKSKDPSVMQNP